MTLTADDQKVMDDFLIERERQRIEAAEAEPAPVTTLAEDVAAATEARGIVARGQGGQFLTRAQALEELGAEETSYASSLMRSGQTVDPRNLAELRIIKALQGEVRQAKMKPNQWLDLPTRRSEIAAQQAKAARDEVTRRTRDQGVADAVSRTYKKFGIIK